MRRKNAWWKADDIEATLFDFGKNVTEQFNVFLPQPVVPYKIAWGARVFPSLPRDHRLLQGEAARPQSEE